MRISPSLLACDFARMGEEAAAMERAGADLLHLDVMDAHFVPNLTLGAPVIRCLRPCTALPFDVHLMMSEPHRYLEDFAKAGAAIINFHVECDSDTGETLKEIRDLGVSPALSLRPATPAAALTPWLDQVDMVLVMTVEPGFGGQRFQEESAKKCRELVQLREERGLSFSIQVDGGIDVTTAPTAAGYGADVFVAGSALFSKSDYGEAVRALREAAQRGAAASEG